MSKNVKVRVASDGTKGFFARARVHARKLDRGEELALEITVSFQDANDMMRILSTERIRLLRRAGRKEKLKLPS